MDCDPSVRFGLNQVWFGRPQVWFGRRALAWVASRAGPPPPHCTVSVSSKGYPFEKSIKTTIQPLESISL